MNTSRAGSLSQLLILELDDPGWSSSLERSLRAIQPGGVLLNPEALRTPNLCAELLHRIARALETPPFLAIAEEGGSMNPLKAFLPPLPAPRLLARRGPAAVKKLGSLIGAALKLLGFNLNLAPCLDLSNSDVQPSLDSQIFGADPELVAVCGRTFIDGLRSQKLLACGSHFPGCGTAEHDENGLPIVVKPMADLWNEDLLPFRQLLPRLPFVKVSNASYKAYDFDIAQPAAMSPKVVHDLLRVKLRYRGLAVADLFALLLEMSGRGIRPSGTGVQMDLHAFVLSIKAGCDLQIVKWGPKTAETLFPAIQRGVESGSLRRERVEEALRRIRAAKKGLKRPTGKLPARSFDHLAREFQKFGQLITAGGKIET